MKQAVLASMLVLAMACAHATTSVTPLPEPKTTAHAPSPSSLDARGVTDAFDAMGDALGHDAGGVEWDDAEVRVGLARAAFFDVRSSLLRADAPPLLASIAKRLRALGGVRVRIDVTLEDEAFDGQYPSTTTDASARLVELATSRATKLVDALVADG